MSAIISDIGGDKRIILSDGYFGRKVSCLQSPNWRKIRVAMRLCMSDSGADVKQPYFGVGLSCGPSFFFGMPGPSPTHSIVCRSGDPAINQYIDRSAGYYTSDFVYAEHYVAGALANVGAAEMENAFCIWGNVDNKRTLFFVDFAKAGTTLTMRCFRNTNTTITDQSVSDFESVSIVEAAARTNHGFNNGTTCTSDEVTYGYYDHVNIFWNKTTPTFKISDLRVIRFN